MSRIIFRILGCCFFLAIVLSACGLANKYTPRSDFQQEGYVYFENKTYKDVNHNGIPINEVGGKDSLFLNTQTRMFIRDHQLVYVHKNIHFANNSYTKTDTMGFDFYDFSTQKFIRFDKLSPDSKIIKRGSINDSGGSFSNTPNNDPMNGISDSMWKVVDTVIDGDTIGVVSFKIMDEADSIERELSKRVKFWINYKVKSFPIQLSHILSKKLKNGFVYKMQLPSPEGKSVMVTSFSYQPAKLPDTLIKVFEKWSQLIKE